MLMYPLGAQSVKCSVCHFVTHVSQQANWGPSSSAGQQQPAQQPKTQTVVVENPPSLDEQGNEVGEGRITQCTHTARACSAGRAAAERLACTGDQMAELRMATLVLAAGSQAQQDLDGCRICSTSCCVCRHCNMASHVCVCVSVVSCRWPT